MKQCQDDLYNCATWTLYKENTLVLKWVLWNPYFKNTFKNISTRIPPYIKMMDYTIHAHHGYSQPQIFGVLQVCEDFYRPGGVEKQWCGSQCNPAKVHQMGLCLRCSSTIAKAVKSWEREAHAYEKRNYT